MRTREPVGAERGIGFPQVLPLRQRAEIVRHVDMQKKVHIHEYHYFSLKRLAGLFGTKARIWIDCDISRGGTFRHCRNLSRLQRSMVGLAEFLVRAGGFPAKVILGNDLWMQYVKE